MKASLVLLLIIFSISAHAYNFNFKRLDPNLEKAYKKRIDQSLAIIKILNAEDDAFETSKGTSLTYNSGEGEININGITKIIIVRQARDPQGNGLYFCEYQFDAQNIEVLRVALKNCKPGARPVMLYQEAIESR